MASNPRIIIFDFDGTIADSMIYLENLAVEVLSKFIPEITAEKLRLLYKETSGRPFCEQVERIIPHKSVESRNKIVTDYEQLKKKSILDQPIFIDAEEILQYLHTKGYTLCISSSSHKSMITNFFEKHGLLVLFSDILGYEENFVKGIDHFSYLVDKYNVSPAEMIFIGDSLEDNKCADDCNINFIAKTGTFSKTAFMNMNPCKHIVSDLIELKTVL